MWVLETKLKAHSEGTEVLTSAAPVRMTFTYN